MKDGDFQPTMALRFVKRKKQGLDAMMTALDFSKIGDDGFNRILQQAWQNCVGEVEWRDIEVVDE